MLSPDRNVKGFRHSSSSQKSFRIAPLRICMYDQAPSISWTLRLTTDSTYSMQTPFFPLSSMIHEACRHHPEDHFSLPALPYLSGLWWMTARYSSTTMLLDILWNSAFRWVYLYFSPLSFTSLLFSAICKASSDNHFAFSHFFLLGMVLIASVQYHEPP